MSNYILRCKLFLKKWENRRFSHAKGPRAEVREYSCGVFLVWKTVKNLVFNTSGALFFSKQHIFNAVFTIFPIKWMFLSQKHTYFAKKVKKSVWDPSFAPKSAICILEKPLFLKKPQNRYNTIKTVILTSAVQKSRQNNTYYPFLLQKTPFFAPYGQKLCPRHTYFAFF